MDVAAGPGAVLGMADGDAAWAGALAALLAPAAGVDTAAPAGELPDTLRDAASRAPPDALAGADIDPSDENGRAPEDGPEDDIDDELAAGHSPLRAAAKASMNRRSTAAASAASPVRPEDESRAACAASAGPNP
jgi:hypothetical protein